MVMGCLRPHGYGAKGSARSQSKREQASKSKARARGKSTRKSTLCLGIITRSLTNYPFRISSANQLSFPQIILSVYYLPYITPTSLCMCLPPTLSHPFPQCFAGKGLMVTCGEHEVVASWESCPHDMLIMSDLLFALFLLLKSGS